MNYRYNERIFKICSNFVVQISNFVKKVIGDFSLVKYSENLILTRTQAKEERVPVVCPRLPIMAAVENSSGHEHDSVALWIVSIDNAVFHQ